MQIPGLVWKGTGPAPPASLSFRYLGRGHIDERQDSVLDRAWAGSHGLKVAEHQAEGMGLLVALGLLCPAKQLGLRLLGEREINFCLVATTEVFLL